MPEEILQLAEETLVNPADRQQFRRDYYNRLKRVEQARLGAEHGLHSGPDLERPWVEQFAYEADRRKLRPKNPRDPTYGAWWYITEYRKSLPNP
ncbi:hypothetical protein QFZ76_007365 [Streptomyces sp. V4I2]|nr:hypothetical protein [Streptomyces sp. V4I2]